jgi:proline dehydrogenase
MDHLGEAVTNEEEANRATDEILQMMDTIEQNRLQSGVSIKLSQIGLNLSEELCIANLERIVHKAREHSIFVRIDMEDSTLTEATLRIFHRFLDQGYSNVLGVVIQAYLYRSLDDVQKLVDRKVRVRLCKGAYKEPPQIAFPKKQDVDANYDRLARMMLKSIASSDPPKLSADGRIPPLPAFATHDIRRIEEVKSLLQEYTFPPQAVEFQMLYGIRRDLQEKLAGEGYPMRVYVPYGSEWYPYFVRRLAERPANLWFFLSNLLRK